MARFLAQWVSSRKSSIQKTRSFRKFRTENQRLLFHSSLEQKISSFQLVIKN